jgi:hypothetical protein
MLASLNGGFVAIILGFLLFFGTFFFHLIKKGGIIMKTNTMIQNFTTGILSSLAATQIHQVWLFSFALS